MAFRRHLLDLLSHEPRSVSSLARELGMSRGDVDDDVRHALRSAGAADHQIEVIPARCKSCEFVFSADKMSKPSQCPACKGTRLFEPMIRIAPATDRRSAAQSLHFSRRPALLGEGCSGDHDGERENGEKTNGCRTRVETNRHYTLNRHRTRRDGLRPAEHRPRVLGAAV